jgi:hypothetical protein
MRKGPRPCVCGHGQTRHWPGRRGTATPRSCALCARDGTWCWLYRPAPRTEPLRARTCGLSTYDCVLRHLDHADHVRRRRPRPTFTTTWPREPGSPRFKVLVRNEARDVVAVCYGTTEGVTLPSNLPPGQRYTLHPILYVRPPVRLRVADQQTDPSTYRRRCPHCLRLNECLPRTRTPLCPQEHPCWVCGERFDVSGAMVMAPPIRPHDDASA